MRYFVLPLPCVCAATPWQCCASKDVLTGTTTLPLQLDNLSEVALDAGMARPMAIPEYRTRYHDIFLGIATFDVLLVSRHSISIRYSLIGL